MQSKVYETSVVVIGSCSVDFTAYAPRLPGAGETLLGTKFATSYGGKGANQCVAAAKLGSSCSMICRFGDDQWGIKYRDHLNSLGINVSGAKLTTGVCTGIAQIVVAENGENQIVIVPGANNHLTINDVHSSSELIKHAEVLIAQLETPLQSTLEAFKVNNGVRLLNAAPARSDILEILPYCSILCVNETEAAILTNLKIDLSNCKQALLKLIEMGCEMVIITLGEQGAVYASREEEPTHVMCEPVTPVDTTGAGDAFVGALATFLVKYKHLPMHQIIGAACKIATISVTKEGTQTSYPENYNAFNQEYKYVSLK